MVASKCCMYLPITYGDRILFYIISKYKTLNEISVRLPHFFPISSTTTTTTILYFYISQYQILLQNECESIFFSLLCSRRCRAEFQFRVFFYVKYAHMIYIYFSYMLCKKYINFKSNLKYCCNPPKKKS